MNASQIKVLTWLVAAGLTLGLSYYVYDFVTHLEEKRFTPDAESVRKWLQPPKAETQSEDDLVAYTRVQETFHRFDWTGAPPPEVVDPGPVDPGPVKTPAKPVADILQVLFIKEDVQFADQSFIYIKYKPSAGVVNPQRKDELLYLGDRLLKPHGHVRVETVSALDGVTFAFDDEERAHETLSPTAFDPTTEIVRVEPGGAMVPVSSSTVIPKVQDPAPFRPRKTAQLGKNTYRIGTEDAEYIGENYTTILSRDVKHRTYTDPRTGKRSGIQVLDVKPDSIAARHGLQKGDIIRSVNGHPVASIQEAINFANNNKDNYDVWVVEIENMGRVRTVTYESPPE